MATLSLWSITMLLVPKEIRKGGRRGVREVAHLLCVGYEGETQRGGERAQWH